MDRCAVWPRPEARCPACGECVAGAMEAHVEKCLQRFSKNPKSAEPCVCVVCRKDITSLDEAQRMAHVNRCLDGEGKEPVQEPVVSTPSRNGSPGFMLLDCPLCERSFKTSEACKNHIKQCSTKLGMSPKQVVEAIRLQQRYVQERMAAGLPVVRRRRNAPADASAAQRPAKKPRPVASVPKSKYQEEVQMARALSASLTTADKDQDEAQRRFCELLGHSSGRRRKHAVKETPLLLLTSADERAKKVEEKIELLLTQRMIGLELGELSWCTKLKATGKLSNRIKELSTKDTPLWSLAGECRERQEDYYLCSLSPVVTPSTVEVGSRLKSLSQVPGRSLSGDLEIVDGLATGKPKPLENDRELSTQLHRDGLLSALNTTLSSTAACLDVTQLKMPDSSEIGQGFLTQETEQKTTKEDSLLTPGGRKVLQDLDALVGHRRFCDIRIFTKDSGVIYAHRSILFTRCPAAEKEVVSRPGEKGLLLNWTKRSKACILAFLHYIYSGALDLDKDDRSLHLDLRGMAFRYGMEELCEELKDRYFRNESEQDDDGDGVADTSLDEILSSFWIDDGGNGHREEDPVSDDGDNVESLEEVCEFLSSQHPQKTKSVECSKDAMELTSETVPVPVPPRASLELTTQTTTRSLLEQSSAEVSQQIRRRPGTPFAAAAPTSPIQSEDELAWMDLDENGHHRDEGRHDDSRGEETDHHAEGTASAHEDSDSCSEELFGQSNDSASSVGNVTEGDEDMEDRERAPSRQEAKRKRDSDVDKTAAQDGSQGSGEKCKDTDDVWDCVWDGFDDGVQLDAAPPERRPPSASRWDRQSPTAAKAAGVEEVPREMLDSFFFEEQGGADNRAAPTGLEHTPVSLPQYFGAPSRAYTPVTPLPDYGAMQTPELRDQLQQYGVRRLPRKQAVNVLNHIYDETHPLVPETPVRITFPKRGMNAGGDRDYRSAPMLGSGRPESFSGSSSANEEPSHYSLSSRSSDEDGSCSDTSDTDIKEQLRRFFRKNTELSESILMYEPIDFQKLRLNLKQANIRISSKSLINYLDEQCITFTMPRSEKQQAKQRRRQENFRRRMLGKRALGTAQEGLPS